MFRIGTNVTAKRIAPNNYNVTTPGRIVRVIKPRANTVYGGDGEILAVEILSGKYKRTSYFVKPEYFRRLNGHGS